MFFFSKLFPLEFPQKSEFKKKQNSKKKVRILTQVLDFWLIFPSDFYSQSYDQNNILS